MQNIFLVVLSLLTTPTTSNTPPFFFFFSNSQRPSFFSTHIISSHLFCNCITLKFLMHSREKRIREREKYSSLLFASGCFFFFLVYCIFWKKKSFFFFFLIPQPMHNNFVAKVLLLVLSSSSSSRNLPISFIFITIKICALHIRIYLFLSPSLQGSYYASSASSSGARLND